ncbi:MAG: hypothetical protein WCT27_04490 [Patescibacteria group bacterium]
MATEMGPDQQGADFHVPKDPDTAETNVEAKGEIKQVQVKYDNGGSMDSVFEQSQVEIGADGSVQFAGDLYSEMPGLMDADDLGLFFKAGIFNETSGTSRANTESKFRLADDGNGYIDIKKGVINEAIRTGRIKATMENGELSLS